MIATNAQDLVCVSATGQVAHPAFPGLPAEPLPRQLGRRQAHGVLLAPQPQPQRDQLRGAAGGVHDHDIPPAFVRSRRRAAT